MNNAACRKPHERNACVNGGSVFGLSVGRRQHPTRAAAQASISQPHQQIEGVISNNAFFYFLFPVRTVYVSSTYCI